MSEVKTYWSTISPPFGAFDDSIIIATHDLKNRLLIRPEEFSDLTNKLHDNWENKKSSYIQILKEWNECLGFNSIDEKPSIIADIEETISAIKLIKGSSKIEYLKLSEEDRILILKFINNYKTEDLLIWKE